MRLLTRRRISTGRSGFTLIELLIVIAIIGVLASLAAGAYQRVRNGRNISNTEIILQKLGSSLDRQARAVSDKARDNQKPIPNTFLQLANGDVPRARALMVKYTLKRSFPVTDADLATSPLLVNVSGYNQPSTALAGVPTSLDKYQKSAALLYRAMLSSPGGTMFNADDLGAGSVKILDGTAEKVFIDAWGKPLYLARWSGDVTFPTDVALITELNNLVPGKTFGSNTYRDPADPEVKLPDRTGNTWVNRAAVQADFGAIFDGHNYVPFVVSDGPDETPNTGDELYSFRVRALQKRGD